MELKEGDLISIPYLHEFGIKIVYQNLIEKGYKVLNVRIEPDVNPQILAEHRGEKLFIFVRSAFYPAMGKKPSIPLINKIKKIAQQNNGNTYIALVGIGNADGQSEADKAKPRVGGRHYILYEGLQKQK